MPTDLGYLADLDLQSSVAVDINQFEHVVGHSHSDYNNTNSGLYRAFIWDDKNGMQGLGTLDSMENSIARGINKWDQVVGLSSDVPWEDTAAAFLWEDGEMLDLNDFLPTGSGWDLFEANDINDHGQIIGRGYFNGDVHGYLLSPTHANPIPSTFLLFGSGLVGLVTLRRKFSK